MVQYYLHTAVFTAFLSTLDMDSENRVAALEAKVVMHDGKKSTGSTVVIN